MYSIAELQLLRAGLDAIMIKGADAKFVAQLQIKLEQQLELPPNEMASKTK